MDSTPLRNGADAIEQADWRVRKIGGTAAGRLRQNADIAEQGNQVLVVSAIRGGAEYDHLRHADIQDRDGSGNLKRGFNTTSHLIALGNALNEGDKSKAHDLINRIERFTLSIVGSEIAQDDKLVTTNLARQEVSGKQVATAQIQAAVRFHTVRMRGIIDQCNSGQLKRIGNDWLIEDGDTFYSITGMAEEMAADIYNSYLRNRKSLNPGKVSNTVTRSRFNAAKINAPFQDSLAEHVLGDNPERAKEERDSAIHQIDFHTRWQMQSLIEQGKTTIVRGGYAPGVGWERGYTETTAMIVAKIVKALGSNTVVVIEGDFAIHSADPNKVPNTQVVLRLTRDAAKELFNMEYGASSGAVQAPSLDIAAEHDIDIVVCNPTAEDLSTNSTLIHGESAEPNGMEIVESKAVPTMLLIHLTKPLQPGFFNEVTSWFAERGVSIDHIPTSANTLTISFTNEVLDTDVIEDFPALLDEFEEAMHTANPDIGEITRHDNQTLLYCIGNNMSGPGAHVRASLGLALSNTPVNMSSVSLADTTMVFGVDTDKADAAMQMIHRIGIEHRDKNLLEVHQEIAS